MKSLSNKNLKILFISMFSVLVFLIINFYMWGNASANDESELVGDGSVSLKGQRQDSGTYKFTRGNNLTSIDLDNEHNPGSSKIFYGFGLDNPLTWGCGDELNHPWANDDLCFGGDSSEGKNNYTFKNLCFCFGEFIKNGAGDSAKNSFGVHYDLKTPWRAEDETQRFKITFGMKYKKADGTNVEAKTWDSFRDSTDGGDNCEVLERAGHKKDYGTTFDEVCKDVQCKTFYDAITSGKVHVYVEEIACEQDYDGKNCEYGFNPNDTNIAKITPKSQNTGTTVKGPFYTPKGDEKIKNVRLECRKPAAPGQRDVLCVRFDSDSSGFFADVDYRFTVVFLDKDGKRAAAFRAKGSQWSDGDANEEIWQSDCIDGDKSVVESAKEWDGTIYIEAIEVAD